jgi:hypothetical protein
VGLAGLSSEDPVMLFPENVVSSSCEDFFLICFLRTVVPAEYRKLLSVTRHELLI